MTRVTILNDVTHISEVIVRMFQVVHVIITVLIKVYRTIFFKNHGFFDIDDEVVEIVAVIASIFKIRVVVIDSKEDIF